MYHLTYNFCEINKHQVKNKIKIMFLLKNMFNQLRFMN